MESSTLNKTLPKLVYKIPILNKESKIKTYKGPKPKQKKIIKSKLKSTSNSKSKSIPILSNIEDSNVKKNGPSNEEFINHLLSNIENITTKSDLINLNKNETHFINSLADRANMNNKNNEFSKKYIWSVNDNQNILLVDEHYNSSDDEDYMPDFKSVRDEFCNKHNTRSKIKLKLKSELKSENNVSLREFKKYNYTYDELKYLGNLSKIELDNIRLCEERLEKIQSEKLPIRFKIYNNVSISDTNKNNIISRINMLHKLDNTDNEYYKLSNWVNWLNKIPFGILNTPEITAKSSEDTIREFLLDTKNILDKSVYGHLEAKEKMLTIIAKIISSPDSKGTCIAIQGPMGNGKTTLVKNGICKAMKRPFGFVPLGGMTDSNYMTGHDYTYEGSKPGRIVEILTECGCMNPIIYFDELDKISQSERGEEISNLLCHLTDTSQNDSFCDKYLSGINLDLSKAIFIFSYNDASLINPILLDRMYKIQTKGFKLEDKVKIATDYLIPELLQEYNLDKNAIIIKEATIKNIIDSYISDEKGVRNLKRALDTVISKLNLLKFIKNPENIVKFNIGKFKLPFEVLDKHLDVLLKQNTKDVSMEFMYM